MKRKITLLNHKRQYVVCCPLSGFVPEGGPVGADDIEKQQERTAERPADALPLESTSGSLYSFILYLSKMVSLIQCLQLETGYYGVFAGRRYVYDTRSYIGEAGLKFTVQPRLTLNY